MASRSLRQVLLATEGIESGARLDPWCISDKATTDLNKLRLLKVRHHPVGASASRFPTTT
jgi:hypothetical protein